MFNTIYAGYSPILSDGSAVVEVLPEDVYPVVEAFSGTSVIQAGYFTPTDTGTHTFNVDTSNGAYLVIDGQVLVNTYSNGTVSANISLTEGQPVSIVYSAPIGPENSINSVSYDVNGRTNLDIQDTQLHTTMDLLSGPFITPTAILSAVLESSTPDCVAPIANIVPTDISSNSLIATVPAPAIVLSVSNVFYDQVLSPGASTIAAVPAPLTGFDSGVTSNTATVAPPTILPPIIDPPAPVLDIDIYGMNSIGIAGSASSFNPGMFNMSATVNINTDDSAPSSSGSGSGSGDDSSVGSGQVSVGPTYVGVNTNTTAGYSTPPAQQYVRAKTIGMHISGMRPNTRLSVFFDGINITNMCAPGDTNIDYIRQSAEPDIEWRLSGNKGDAITTDATGTAVAVFNVPPLTFTTGTKNIAAFNYTSPTDSYQQKYANNTCRAFSAFHSVNYDGKSQEDVVIFATAPADSGSSANNMSGRTGGSVIGYTTQPLCQSFYIGSDMSKGQDGVFLSSIDLYFSAKSNTQPVSIEIRSVENDMPTKTIIPYSQVTLPSSSVNIANSATSNSTYSTKFSFPQPVFLRAGYYYALAINPGGQSPDYSVWTATVGKTTANGAVNANWGQGKLYKSTSTSQTWTSVPNQFLRFNVNRTEYADVFASNGTAVITNGDYEFISFINPSKIPFRVGEYVYQQPTAHVAICSVNTSSNTLTVNTTAYGGLTAINPTPLSDFAVNDHIVVCGGFPAVDPGNLGRFNFNLFGNAVTLKVLSVGAGGMNLVFGYANGAAITGTPWANGACHVYKVQPGQLSYTPGSKTVVGTGTRFDVNQNANERDNTNKRPLIVHAANNTHWRHEVLWPNNIINATSLSLKNTPLNSIPANSTAIPIDAPAGKVARIDYARNLIVLEKSTANGSSGANSAANVYSSPTFFATGRTLVGTSSGATAIVSGVHDMIINSAQPIVQTSAPQGTSITYVANVTTSSYAGIEYPNYKPDRTNYFTNNEIIIASKTNEVLKMNGRKSMIITATLSSNSTLLTPTLDFIGDASLLTKSNIINSSAINEHKNNGLALSKSVSKPVTLSEGNDAEDITVYLTAYKPIGTNIIVYAKLLNAADGDKFEDKDWSVLRQVTDATLFSDTANQNDYKEYEFTLPTNPVAVPAFELLTCNNSATIVSTNGDTKWQQRFRNGQLVTLYSDIYASNFEVNQISTVNSNTNITLSNPVTLANTSSAIIASMPYPYSAFKNSNNGNIVRYYNSTGSAFDSFRKFAIKIVFTSQSTNLVPKVADMRVLALSV